MCQHYTKGVITMNFDLNAILTAITTVGFPIVCCGGLFYYLIFKDKKHKDEIQVLSDTLTENVSAMTTAINNNTIVMAEICGKLGVDVTLD